MKNPLAGSIAFVVGTLVLLTLIAGFVPDKGKMEIRRPFTGETTQAKGLMPVTRPLSHLLWNMRGNIGLKHPEPQTGTLATSPRRVLEVKGETVNLWTASGMAPLVLESENSALLPLFPAEIRLVEEKKGNVPLFFAEDWNESDAASATLAQIKPVRAIGEPLDFQGMPLRWNGNQKACELTPEARERTEKLLADLKAVAKLPPSLKQRAERYRTSVEKYAARYKLTPELVYAMIYTESSFNPSLISERAAHGLMQVVPHTAGGEVHKWFGQTGLPAPDVLLNPDTNIKYGTAYFYLLQTRHLNAITNPQSREYCAIAAYNIGTGGMLRTFGSSHAEAFAAINALEPEAVLETLRKKLPSRETRGFLNKVLALREKFSVMS